MITLSPPAVWLKLITPGTSSIAPSLRLSPKAAVRRVGADDADHRHRRRQLPQRRRQHPPQLQLAAAEVLRKRRVAEHDAAPIRLIVEQPSRHPGPAADDRAGACLVRERAQSFRRLRVDREVGVAGDCHHVAVRSATEVRTLHLDGSVCIDAPAQDVWAALARLEDIQLWSEAVVRARWNGAITRSVGAERTCDLVGGVTIKERWLEWDEGHSFSYEGASRTTRCRLFRRERKPGGVRPCAMGKRSPARPTKYRSAHPARPSLRTLRVSASSPEEALTSPWSCRPAPAGGRLAAESGARVGTDAGDQRMWPWQEGLFDD
jgi:Polyketide cyclase / dehydrase and lipid transport